MVGHLKGNYGTSSQSFSKENKMVHYKIRCILIWFCLLCLYLHIMNILNSTKSISLIRDDNEKADHNVEFN